MFLAILSDIHANFEAFNAVMNDIALRINGDDYRIVILGDTINYGVRPNEVIEGIRNLDHIDVLLAGNHEMALFGVEDDRFSSQRGRAILETTKKVLTEKNMDYIKKSFVTLPISKRYGDKDFLFVHGAIEDKYWGTIVPSTSQSLAYKKYDVVLSGHSHKPHFFEVFYEDDCPKMRNKKKTTFINPGSVGQPRNHCTQAQYVILNTDNLEATFCKVNYNIGKEQDFYKEYQVDKFYQSRIGVGV